MGFVPYVLVNWTMAPTFVSSETCSLDIIGAKFVRDVQPGELIIIDRDGMKIDHFTKNTHLAICSMEYIYLLVLIQSYMV